MVFHLETSDQQTPDQSTNIGLQKAHNFEATYAEEFLLELVYNLQEARFNASALTDKVLLYFLDMAIMHARNTLTQHLVPATRVKPVAS
jgi:hypothetical protein